MELYLISYPHFFKGEAKIVSALFEKYEFTYHLRKPAASDREYEDFLKQIPIDYHSKIIIHGAWHLQNSYGIKGCHFSTSNRKKINGIKVRGMKSTSCHSIPEVQTCTDFNYVFLGPVFDSISKPNYKANTTINDIQNLLKQSAQPKVIALGGIHANNIARLNHFDGIAVLGAVWGNQPENPNTIMENFKNIYECLPQDHIA